MDALTGKQNATTSGSKPAAITLSVFSVISLLFGLAVLSAGIWMRNAGHAGVLAFLKTDKIVTLAKNQLSEMQNDHLLSVNDYMRRRRQPSGTISNIYYYVFVAFGCCGVKNSEDARLSQSWQKSNRTWVMKNATTATMLFPAACCPVQASKKSGVLSGTRWPYLHYDLEDVDCPVTGVGVHKNGCFDAVLKFIEHYANRILMGCGVFFAAQFVALIFTLYMVCSTKNVEVADDLSD